MTERLPIEDLRADFLAALDRGPVVVSSPTGSGKSTQVPRWCPGRVLVVEPRRVACRGLAQRVAELEGSPLGEAVGYQVRDERRAGEGTRVLFVTPGVALRVFDSLAGYETVILDEFHERGLEVDLLLALLLARRPRSGGPRSGGPRCGLTRPGRLVVMSATLEGERVAAHLEGHHLHAEGRLFPVETHYLDGGTLLPSVRGLEERVLQALEFGCERSAGDVLVFLPGKAEIRSCARALRGVPDLEVLELHGGLTLKEQSRAFRPAARRKAVLATNVAETSITLPGVGVVIDSGLVRQTRFHRGRGHLTLVPIARDSADQRRGRAGRTAAGVCCRLWSEAAQLEARTPPEVHRESLVPLVLAAAACGERADELPFLDPPREHALAAARGELRALEALRSDGRITERGRQLFGLPIDAPLGRLLVEAEGSPGLLADMIDLVSVLAVGRSLFAGAPPPEEGAGPAEGIADDPPAAACDATMLLRALRGVGARRANPFVLAEARAVRARLRRLFELPGKGPATAAVDRKRLALAVLAADPRAAHVARRRARRLAWSNGGTEIELGRESAVARLDAVRRHEVEAIVVLDTRAVGPAGARQGRGTRVLATCAMPVPLEWLVEAGLGRERLGKLAVEDGRAVAHLERVYARRVLAVRRDVPRGRLARKALARLFLAGEIFPASLAATRERLAAAALAAELASGDAAGDAWKGELEALFGAPVPALEEWTAARLERLGVESGEDLALLSDDDLLAPDLPPAIRRELDRRFPRALKLPGASYEIDYDVGRRQVTLRQVTGHRLEAPPLTYLPRFPGFRIRLEHKGSVRTLRGPGA